MRAPLSWLKEFTNLSLSPFALSDVMTLAGLEVDKVESTPFTFTKVIVAEVKETAPHPNADKLKVAQVFDLTDRVCSFGPRNPQFTDHKSLVLLKHRSSFQYKIE